MATKANKSTNNVDAEIIINNRRAETIKKLLDGESCDNKVKKRCKDLAMKVAKSIKAVTTHIMVKIGKEYRSMPIDSFRHEIDGLKRLVKLMIQEIQRILKQQPQPAV